MSGHKPTVYGSPGTLTCSMCGSVQAGSGEVCTNCGAKMTSSSGIAPGTIIDGKYEILGLLGVGGMGEAFKARHIHLHAFRCIKVMKKSLLADESFRKRFLREARLATQLNHHNLAPVHDFSTLKDGSYYMVTEFIDGITVRQWGTRHGRFPLPLAVEITTQVLSGLEHCHRRGLLHRDISADNIMIALDSDGHPNAKIIDLGIAKQTTSSSDGATQVGLFVGNPKYSSPEQLGQLPEGEDLDGRADLYSLGVVLYEMVMGAPPFSSKTPQGYVVKHLTTAPRRFGECHPDLQWPDGFEAVVMKALEKDRRRRYASAREFGTALAPYAGEVTPAMLGSDVAEELTQRISLTSPATLLPKTEALPTGERDQSQTSDASILPTMRDGQTPAPMLDQPLQRDQQDWAKATKTGTREAYQAYLQDHVTGSFAGDAKSRIEELRLIGEITESEASRNIGHLDELAKLHTKTTAAGKAARDARARVRERIAREEQEEKKAWDQAWEKGTSAAWESFLSNHPETHRTEEAQHALAETREFEAARKADTVAKWQVYLDSWPEGRRRDDAETALARAREKEAAAAFRKAAEADTTAALREFLTKYPRATDSARAQNLLAEREAFDHAAAADSEASWQEYLSRWGSDRHASQAKERLVQAHRREEERRALAAFREAIRVDTAQSVRDFLQRYPNSSQTDEARKHLDERSAFEKASAVDSEEAWQQYLLKWEKDSHADQARSRLAEARKRAEQRRALEAFQKAKSADTAAALRDFIDKYSASPLVAEARPLLAERVDFEKAASSDTEESWESYLSKWASDRHSETAKLRLAGTRRRVEETLQRALREESSEALDQFLQQNPRSSFRAQAEEALRETRQWEAVKSETSPEPVRSFLSTYPKSRFAKRATEQLARIEEAAFQQVLASTDVRGTDRFLAQFPDSRKAAEVQRLKQDREEIVAVHQAIDALDRGDAAPASALVAGVRDAKRKRRLQESLSSFEEKRDWEAAQRDNNLEAYRRYLQAHPRGEHAGAATQRVTELELLAKVPELEKNQREDELQQLTEKYPESTALGKASRASLARVQEILSRQRREEERDWQRAWDEGSVDSWTRFVKKHPRSPGLAEAKRMIAEAESFQTTADADNSTAWQRYLTAWPEGRHHTEAALRLEWAEQRESEARPAPPVQDESLPPITNPEATMIQSPAVTNAEATLIQSGLSPAGEQIVDSPQMAPAPPVPVPELQREPITTVIPSTPPLTEPRPARRSPIIPVSIAAGLLLVAVIGIFMVMRGGGKKTDVTDVEPKPLIVDPKPPIVVPEPPDVDPQPPGPVVKGNGTLVIDAIPWAEIKSVSDASGKQWLETTGNFTPLVLSLPPGDYKVTFANPNSRTKTVSMDTQVISAETRSVVGKMIQVDTDAYLKEAGLIQ